MFIRNCWYVAAWDIEVPNDALCYFVGVFPQLDNFFDSCDSSFCTRKRNTDSDWVHILISGVAVCTTC